MYEYKYVNLYTGGGFFLDNSDAAHRELIDEQAKDGWRFVAAIPTSFTSNGGTKSLDLVFERKTEHESDL